MRLATTSLALALIIGSIQISANGPQNPTTTAGPGVAADAIDVPQGDGAPVITDGIFTPGEWGDALEVVVNDGVRLYFKDYRGVVFVGVRGGQHGIGPSDLSLAAPGGAVHRLHVSFALGEVVLPAAGDAPRMRLGLTTDWYANELRRDEEEFARLVKAGGRSPMEIMQATSYPSEGLEFAIRRAKVPGRVWLLRLWTSAFVDGKPAMVTYPAAAQERAIDGWLELHLN
jgi:hypothetical protein